MNKDLTTGNKENGFTIEPNHCSTLPRIRSLGHTETFDTKRMTQILLDQENFNEADLNYVFQLFNHPLLLDSVDSTGKRLYNKGLQQARDMASVQMNHLYSDLKLITDDPYKIVMRIALCSLLNSSVGTKCAAQAALFGGSLLNLGTKEHKKLVPSAERLDLIGCFAMTELTHGSNVKALQTTATYDIAKEEFVIHTPHKGAIKWWIGNALSATLATVFARLIIGQKDYGVHAFIVPLRDEDSNMVLPGITIGDCGDKNGLNGIDNGFIKFDHVRIPRKNLLNRYGTVEPDGTYHSPFKNEARRFGALLGELTTGRCSIAVATIWVRKSAVTIATRYAFQRKQFGPDTGPEVPIIEHPSHSIRLMPIIASCYAGDFACKQMLRKYLKTRKHSSEVSPEEIAETHALTAGLKAIFTWDTQKYLQIMRECCGGHGYSAYSRFGLLSNDHDITLTYEGDNTILIQQVGAYLLKQFSKQFQGDVIRDSLTFLRMKIGTRITKKNPIITRLATRKHLKSSEFHLQAFEYRTARLLQNCAATYQKEKKKHGDFISWGVSVPTIIRLGRAFVEQFALEQFVAELNTIPDKTSDVYNVLKLVCEVYALSIMDSHIGEFADLVKSNKASAITKLFEELCVEMKEHALSLVDSFSIPDFLLDSPLGQTKENYVDLILKYTQKAPFNAALDINKLINS